MKVHDKVLVVTGAGSGIGRALVLALLAKGARIAAVDVNGASLDTLREAVGAQKDRLATFVVDITDRAKVQALPAEVVARFGAVDGVVNNAGIIQPFVRLKDLDDAAIDRVMGVNLYGTLWMTRAFLPLLLARPVAHVVNVSSMGGFLPVPGQTIYGAAKAAVKLLTEGLGAELAGTNVRVTVVFPGAIATNIATNSGVQLDVGDAAKGRSFPMTPAPEAARIIVEGIERDRARILVGRDAKLMDALYRLNPERATRFIAKQMGALLGR